MFRRLLLALLLAGVPLCAQTVHPPVNQPVFRAFDANGVPLAGGKLYSYAAGSSTPLATYADALNSAPNTNPVILDASGSAKVFLASANYKLVLTDANGVQQWTVDNITGSPNAGGVTSFNGRTGAVLALTGDYSCAQITGAVCSTQTLYYQTVQNAGTLLPQRASITLLSGTGATASCADNATNNSTDCTVSAAVPTTVTTAANSFAVIYHNTDLLPRFVTVSGSSTVGCTMNAMVGSASPPTQSVGQFSAVHAAGTSVSTTYAMGTFVVPAGWYYEVTTDGCLLNSWTEVAW